MRVALCQINPTIGAIDDNARLITDGIRSAREAGADLAVFPELSISGYPPRDLLFHEGFVEACGHAAKSIGETETAGLTAVFGLPLRADKGGLANSLVVYRDNRFVEYYDKRLLPTYDVFDEDRYFVPGDRTVVVEVGGERIGLAICEDLWKGEDAGFASRYSRDPIEELARNGISGLICPSASPFVLGKERRHHDLLARHAQKHGVWVASVNVVGANDDLIFDGHSAVYDSAGERIATAPGFAERMLVVDTQTTAATTPDPLDVPEAELVFKALRLGVADYCRKTGFTKALIGLSGGIDSAVTCAIAAAALGPQAVVGIGMPGKYSSDHSVSDAAGLASRLGVRFVNMPIGVPFDGFASMLDAAFDDLGENRLGQVLPDLTEENLQSRIRGTALMALSNRTGAILLTTGNKSEMAVGYCTLYGDMNGGLAVLSDVRKNLVYDLARWMNDNHEKAGFDTPPIPESTIEKPPSAELAPGQQDSDSLPPYDVLDEIVRRYVEVKQSPTTIQDETGFDAATIDRIIGLIERNEYKRQQAALGLKITNTAFGSGRRVPIAKSRKLKSEPSDFQSEPST